MSDQTERRNTCTYCGGDNTGWPVGCSSCSQTIDVTQNEWDAAKSAHLMPIQMDDGSTSWVQSMKHAIVAALAAMPTKLLLDIAVAAEDCPTVTVTCPTCNGTGNGPMLLLSNPPQHTPCSDCTDGTWQVIRIDKEQP